MNGHIRNRGKNTWQLIYELPRDATDRRQQGRQTVHGSRKVAEAKLREILTSLDKGEYVTPTRETVGAFLDRWMEIYAASATSDRTQQDYRSIIARYLKPALGPLPLAALRPDKIQAMYGDLQARGLSALTVLHTHRLLKQALSHAVKWQVISRNACEIVDPPRPEAKEMRTLDQEGVSRFMAAWESSQFRDVFFLALHTGLRRSEALGLRWEQVDMEHSRLQVIAGLHRINGKGLVMLPTKTRRSRRSVSFSSEVADLLREIRGNQLIKQVEFAGGWSDTGYVFTDELGNPIDPGRVSKEFARVTKTVGLGQVRLHDLRHTHASLLLAANVHPKIVSERLGHASVTITLDTYSHVIPGLQEDAAEKFSRILADGR